MIDAPVLCVGETLWDVLPSGEFLGGAPLNVAGHLTRLGTPVVLLSRVGNDARGQRARERMLALGMDTTQVQVDPEFPTGEARAVLDASGSAAYQFLRPAAWDRIEASAQVLEIARAAPAMVFGTLGQRSASTRDVIQRLLRTSRWRILDINLRAPHDDRDTALASLALADFVKLNEDEVNVIARWLEVAPDPDALRRVLGERYGIRSLCITRGAGAATLWHEGQWVEQAAYPTVVADTVGAGDSFLAMLLCELLRGSPAGVAMDRAARLAAFVASRSGAIPDYPAGEFEQV